MDNTFSVYHLFLCNLFIFRSS